MRAPIASIAVVFLMILLSSCDSAGTLIAPTGTSSPVPLTNSPERTTTSPTIPTPADAPYNENAVPKDDIAHALIESEKDGKLVLLDFGANWCPDCLVLSTLFEDPAVRPFLEENFHVVSIDVGYWDKNLDVSQQYENPIENGIPAVVVLAPDGEIIATTKDGALANARTATAQDILTYLEMWLSRKP